MTCKIPVEYSNQDCSNVSDLNFERELFRKMSRIAIVTGANKGIGLETTRALAKSGLFKKVYLTSRNVDLGLTALKGKSFMKFMNIIFIRPLRLQATTYS